MLQFDLTVAQVAELVSGEVVGDSSVSIHSINKIESASKGQLSFVAATRFEKFLTTTQAGCVLIGVDQKLPESIAGSTSYIRVKHPHRAIVKLINHFQHHLHAVEARVDPTASVDPTAQVHLSAVVSAGCIVGRNCTVGEGCVLHPYVVLGENVTVGDNTVIRPHVTIYEDVRIGARCIIHAGAVIGSDGFGYLDNDDGSYEKIPQIGNVVIEDDVEIGASSCVDRAALGSTLIKKGVKIDNLVHIAHNVEIGENTAIAALTGIAGGAVIGARNRIAGQVGIVGYIATVENVTIGAQSGVSKSISQAGVYSGSPAVELRQRLRQEAAIRRLS